MWADVTQFRNTSGPSTTRELCKNVSQVDIMFADTYIGKRKLNQTGILILKEYLRLHPEDTHPTAYTLNTLLDRVRNAQNNQDIPYNSISSWFQRRRTILQKQALRQSTASSTPPTMPFGQDNLHKLQTLVNATPNPSPDVLDTWASLFHVSKAILLHAIHVILSDKAPRDVCQSQIDAEQTIQRLPTPANSLTPEPSPAANDGGSPKFMKNECHTPTLAISNATDPGRDMVAQFQQPRDHSAINSNPASALHDHDQVARPQLSPPPTPTVPAAQANSQASGRAKTYTTAAPVANPFITRTIFSGIVEACSEAVQGSHETVQPPKTAAEFEALFAPYKTKLEDLSRVLDVTFENSPAD